MNTEAPKKRRGRPHGSTGKTGQRPGSRPYRLANLPVSESFLLEVPAGVPVTNYMQQIAAAQAALDALQVAIDAWGQTESPPGAIEAARERLRAELGLPSVGQVVNEIQAERLSIERACGLGDRIAPCPFCGSENVELICSGSAWFVECRECQATGPMLVDGEDRDSIRAVELWAIPPRTRHPLSGKSESIANQTKDVPPL